MPERKVDWIGEGLVPVSSITVLESHPGVGKSLLAAHIMARVTRGKFSSMAALAMPENVLYIDGEHSPAVLFARMVAANAHIERIIRVNGHSDGEADIFSALKRSLGDVSPALIVVDPLCSVLRHAHDMGAFQAVVSALQEIAWVAGRQS